MTRTLTEFITMWRYGCAVCGALIETATSAYRASDDGTTLCPTCRDEEVGA